MILASELVTNEDREYLIRMRREIHMHPEIEYDLPVTTATVGRELDSMGISYTDKYVQSSLVGYLGPDNAGLTVALRADMDALAVEERTGLPFASQNPGKMHACGHDAHTAILLTVLRVLKRNEDKLACRVKFFFQPCEEGGNSGANNMVKNGIMDDVDMIIGLHCCNDIEAGTIGIYPGAATAARHRYIIEFFGKSAHAAAPHTGHDALAMAVKAYNDLQIMQTREINPLERHLCCIGSLQAGTTDNIIPAYARLMVSVRTFDLKLDQFICDRIIRLSENAASELGGEAKISHQFEALPVFNDHGLCDQMRRAVTEALGAEYAVVPPIKISSEDFSYYVEKKPGCFVDMGTRNAAKGCVGMLHNNDFTIDEDGLINGCKAFVQFVMDRNHESEDMATEKSGGNS